MSNFSVAIDGPAGSGKSTVAKNIAERLKITYIDTGAMYRAVALYCINKGVDTTDKENVIKSLGDIKLDIKQSEKGQIIILNGVDVTLSVRTIQVGKCASDVAIILEVRQKLVEIQRQLSKGKSIVMDGRDIGTNVLPNATIKIYLNASVDERTKRRISELKKIGQYAEFDEIRNQIVSRDQNDSNREHNPLCKAADAVEIDTTNMNIDEVVQEIMDIAQLKIG